MSSDQLQKPVKLEPKISVGNILTVIGMVVAGFMAWQSLNIKVSSIDVRLEERSSAILQRLVNIENIMYRNRQTKANVPALNKEEVM